MSLPVRVAARIAWRETRSSMGRFAFVVFAIAVGVGALAGVRGFSGAFREMLLREARTLMAADLSVRIFAEPAAEQQAVLRELEGRNVRLTRITETVSMATSTAALDPLLVSLKAVDPGVYPFYGSVDLQPAVKLPEALSPDAVAVSDDLQYRLQVKTGDRVRLGKEEFRIAGVVAAEPDKMNGSLNVGPRILMSRAALERTGLMVAGSRASQRFLLKLDPGSPPVEQVRAQLAKAFPEARIVDFRETHPLITRGLDNSTTFLSLVSLIALIVAALGVATAMHAHLQQRLDSIAIMKCVGGRSGQILRIYVLQAAFIGLAGGVLGAIAGLGVQRAFPVFLKTYFPSLPSPGFRAMPAVEAVAMALLVTLLFTAPTLLGIRRIRPAVIFRREMADAAGVWRSRWRNSGRALLTGAALIAGIAALAGSLILGGWETKLRVAGFFAGGLTVSLLLLGAVAWALLRGLRAIVRAGGRRLPVEVRHGLANLYRPGNHAEAILVALGVGVMFTTTIYLVQRGLLERITASAPPDMPNVFLVNITARDRAPLETLLRGQKGLVETPQLIAAVPARMTAVDGVAPDKLKLEGWGRRFLGTRYVTWAGEKPKHARILQGEWISGKDTQGEAAVSIIEDAAQSLKVKIGSRLEWSMGGRTVTGRVTAIHRYTSGRGATSEFIFNESALAGLPVNFYGAVRVRPNAVAALQRASYAAFPTVTVVNMADVLDTVEQIVDQVAVVIRFISGFAVLAGVVILASGVAGTRFRRVRETAILKAIGATRNRLATIFSVEFAVLGVVAGLMGSLLATAFSSLLLKRLLDADAIVDPLVVLAACGATALVATGAGWLASSRILSERPLPVLRGE